MVNIKEFAKLDIRIAEVIAAELHPNADKLLVLQIAVGEEKRSVVAGIRKEYSPEQLIGKKVVVVMNLEPATIRGIESQGMVLCASNDEKIVLLTPEKDIDSGAKVR